MALTLSRYEIAALCAVLQCQPNATTKTVGPELSRRLGVTLPQRQTSAHLHRYATNGLLISRRSPDVAIRGGVPNFYWVSEQGKARLLDSLQVYQRIHEGVTIESLLQEVRSAS